MDEDDTDFIFLVFYFVFMSLGKGKRKRLRGGVLLNNGIWRVMHNIEMVLAGFCDKDFLCCYWGAVLRTTWESADFSTTDLEPIEMKLI